MPKALCFADITFCHFFGGFLGDQNCLRMYWTDVLGSQSSEPSVYQRNVGPSRQHFHASATTFFRQQQLHYTVSRTRTKFGDRAFLVAGPVIWNSIPESIRVVDNVHAFKRLLKCEKALFKPT